jgi:hypothetical protein
MKVSGPNSGPGIGAPDAAAGAGPDEVAGAPEGASKAGAAGEIGAADASSAVGRTESSGRAFAEKLAAAGTPSGSPAAPAATARPPEPHATSAVAAALDAGQLTPGAAVDKVLEQVLARQVGADAPAAVRERVRAALKEALESDPLLAEKLKRLGT